MAMYTADNRDTFPYTPSGWWHMPLIDLLALQNQYISTNNRSFYRCSAEKGIGFNYQLVQAVGGNTNELPFSCSYTYYAMFYSANHKINEVKHPTQKAVQVCFASANNDLFDTDKDPPINGAHGAGLNWLFVDGHSQFVKWSQMNRMTISGSKPYNYDMSPLDAMELNQ